MDALKLLKLAASTVAAILAVSLIWSVGSGFLAKRYPFWVWNNGTAAMQEKAIPGLLSQIRPGEEIATVIERLGPGSAHGKANLTMRLGYEGELAFGIRSDGNIGIIVRYRNGKVEATEQYR